MTRRLEKWYTWGAMGCMMVLGTMVTSCINEDLSDCGWDYEVIYSLQLHTSLHDHIEQEMTSARERELGNRLKEELSDVFVEHAHDISLAFYEPDSTCSYFEEHVPNAASASFSIYLPVKEYMHLAVANHRKADNVELVDIDYVHTAALRHPENEVRSSQQVGLFSARLPMEVEYRKTTHHANLYMINCASAVIINPNDVQYTSVQAQVVGTANHFIVRDSLYNFPQSESPVQAEQLADTGSELLCLYAVSFPSRDQAVRSRADEAHEAAWQYRIYVTLADGSITESTLHIKEPLQAGHLHILSVSINPQGAIIPDDPSVGVSIELDWKQGGVFEPEM